MVLMASMMRGDEALPDDMNAFHRAINAGSRLVTRFVGDHGTTSCRDLLDADLGTDDGCRTYLADDKVPKCRKIVAGVALHVREIFGISGLMRAKCSA